MAEQSDPPRKMSRQERRLAERQGAKGPVSQAERVNIDNYAREAGALARQLRESQERVHVLMKQLTGQTELFDDEAWRSAVITECRSWRQLLAALPEEAPR